MDTVFGIVIGLLSCFVVRCLLSGFSTIDQNQRGVKTRFGRAVRVPGGTTTLDDPIAVFLRRVHQPFRGGAASTEARREYASRPR
jgi:regulator of protease activity HflC (stomatin/prohibitin superfamily)